MSRHPSSLCLFVTVFRYPDTFNLAHVNPVDQSRHLIPAETFRDQTPKGSNLEYILAHNNITVIQTGLDTETIHRPAYWFTHAAPTEIPKVHPPFLFSGP